MVQILGIGRGLVAIILWHQEMPRTVWSVMAGKSVVITW